MALKHWEIVRRNAQRCVMMKGAPAMSIVMTESQLGLQFLVIALDYMFLSRDSSRLTNRALLAGVNFMRVVGQDSGYLKKFANCPAGVRSKFQPNARPAIAPGFNGHEG